MAMAAAADAPATFRGFSPEAIQFLADLAVNNDRAWFQPRKAEYERLLKEPFEAMIAALADRLEARGVPLLADPKRSPFRIYRDTRFSKDKTPYKDHIAASFHHRALTGQGAAGFYFHVSHKDVGIGGGVYMTMPGTLLAIRNHLAAEPAAFRKILKAPAVKKLFGEMQGEQLTRVPKGFTPGHPAADLVRYKQFLLWTELPPDVATSKELYPEIIKRFRAMTPFLRFLNAPLKPQKKAIDPLELFR
jgi:uncharacterized protein (TIGR02453 family)